VLQPRVERRDVTIPKGQRLGEEELLSFVVLDRAGSEEPDADVKERVGNENGTERHPRSYGERLDPVGDPGPSTPVALGAGPYRILSWSDPGQRMAATAVR
jgi:hypothetical protein